ncbi:carboxypeptidase-like regulatory domain-containing protein [Dactylosporangium sp. NPDC051541]|uniref:carboxypeptidase-like regulatory domain-containing protein n=1 Tax=Dactylosporangium sp. NPDC051541 TaxID=3363977 RepID=UPI0037BBADD4
MRKDALRRSLLLAVASATVATGLAVPATPALAAATATGTVTGHLTDNAGNPLAYASVSAEPAQFGIPATGSTDEHGDYTISGLDAGDYVVSFRPFGAGYTQWAHRKSTRGAADHITVAAGATVVVNDQALPTGRITGALHNADGSPAEASISVYTAEGQNWVGSGFIQPDGTFSLEVLPGSGYKLNFTNWPAISQWNGGQLTFGDAAAITVPAAGQTVALPVETLVGKGSIAGRLTYSDGRPAAGVAVAANLPSCCVNGYTATTDSDGRYRMDGVLATDKWIVGFTLPNNITQYAHGRFDRDSAARVAVTAGQVSTVDEQLLPLGKVRIRAHDAVTGAPLSGFCAFDRRFGNLSDCATGTELVYDNVFAGAWGFDIYAQDHRHFNAYNVPLTVVGGPDNTLDVALRPGAAISVPLVKQAGGAAVTGCVRMARSGDIYPPPSWKACSSDPDAAPGAVLVGPLEPGTYQIFADPDDAALGAQWVGPNGGTGDREAAKQFTLTVGAPLVVPAVRFDAAGSIRGKVTDAVTGAPLEYACVSVIAQFIDRAGDGCEWTTMGATTGADGSYTLSGLGPYAWPVEFTHFDHQWRWLGNQASRLRAPKVTVTVGATAAVVDYKLYTGGGTITGKFTDAAGHPVDGDIVPFNSLTGDCVGYGGWSAADSGGTYSVPQLAPLQSVKLRWEDYTGRSGWVGGADFAHATAFPIQNNKTVTVNIVVS